MLLDSQRTALISPVILALWRHSADTIPETEGSQAFRTVQEDVGHLWVASEDVRQFICPLSVSFYIYNNRHRTTQDFQFLWSVLVSPRSQTDWILPILRHCFAFFRMVPTAEMTVVLVPLAVVVTETTAGRVAVVVMMVGWARVTGIAESHLLFRFWASAGESKHMGGVSGVGLQRAPRGTHFKKGTCRRFCWQKLHSGF